MADDEDDIVWIREEPQESVSPTTPATIVDVNEADKNKNNKNAFFDSSQSMSPEKQVDKPSLSIERDLTNGVSKKTDEDMDRLSTRHANSRPPDSPSSCGNSTTFDISECERNFNRNTAEARQLLDEIERKSQLVEKNNQEAAKDLQNMRNDLQRSDGTIQMKTIDDVAQVPAKSIDLPTGGLPKNVESVLIGDGVLEEITGTLILPNRLVLATDERHGLVLFTMEGDVVHRLNSPQFRRIASPIFHKEHIMILADVQNAESHWVRHIVKFTMNLEYVAKIECPQWLAESTILRERLGIAHNDHLYLCVCGEIFSGLYELTPIGQWTELEYKLSEAYVDMLAFSTIGPITQILVVEGRRNYVLLVSVRESRVVDKKRMAICERPGALAKDEAGRLFVANRSSASIQLVDTRRWVCEKNVAISEAFVRHFTACWGLLAIPLKNSIRLQKYSFRSIK